jgi:predicted Rdx family selenoprotein
VQAKAASYADLIHKELGQEVELTPGRWGQFEILVDGAVVASRKSGLIAKLIKRPWPDPDEVVTAVRARLG